MPRQVFTAGEILTAANMNDLSDQTVMVFDDSTARGSAIPSPSEGMVTYLKDTNALEKYDGSNFVDAAPEIAGIGSNVVTVVKTDTFSASLAAGASTTVTGLSLSFTPTTATSKVLVLCQITGGRSAAARQYAALRADTTLIDVGASAGSRQQAAAGYGLGDAATASGLYIMALHSPATTSAVTYDVVISHSSSGTDTVYVNRGPTDSDAATNARTASRIVAIEVAA